jgi:hypothetical protein
MIKQIFDEIAAESSTNRKVEILSKYKDNELLKEVLYKACSKRVKFYIKQIPEYTSIGQPYTLEQAVVKIEDFSTRALTGNAAIGYLQKLLMGLPKDDAYILERIIEKDPKIGFGTRMLNKVWPDLIEKVGYQGCKPYSRDLVEKLFKKYKKIFSQLKLDGQYINIIIDDSAPTLESRQGEPTNLEAPKFLEELKKLPNGVLNAELTMDGVERYKSNGIITSLISIANKKSNGENASKEIAKFESKHMPYRDALDLIRVTAWDLLTLEEYYSRTCTRIYDDRLEELNKVLSGFEMLSVVETRVVKNKEDAMAHFEEVLSRNLEGTVLKAADGLWVDSKPAYQIKLKKEVKLDLRVVGFSYGDKGTKNENVISSLVVQSEDGLLKATAGGIDEEGMEDITNNQDKYLNTIAEIKCNGVSITEKGYSLLHPRYIKSRIGDKDIANTLEECLEIHKASSL